MLQFIVLGEVPGTAIQVSLNEILIACGCLLVLSELVIARRRKSFKATLERLHLEQTSI